MSLSAFNSFFYLIFCESVEVIHDSSVELDEPYFFEKIAVYLLRKSLMLTLPLLAISLINYLLKVLIESINFLKYSSNSKSINIFLKSVTKSSLLLAFTNSYSKNSPS